MIFTIPKFRIIFFGRHHLRKIQKNVKTIRLTPFQWYKNRSILMHIWQNMKYLRSLIFLNYFNHYPIWIITVGKVIFLPIQRFSIWPKLANLRRTGHQLFCFRKLDFTIYFLVSWFAFLISGAFLDFPAMARFIFPKYVVHKTIADPSEFNFETTTGNYFSRRTRIRVQKH